MKEPHEIPAVADLERARLATASLARTASRARWARAEKRPYTFSWFERETSPAPRTWRDRLLFRRPTMFTWRRHVVVLHVAEVNVERFGGWQAILDAFLLPMIPAGAGGVNPWGTQIEWDGGPVKKSIPCAEQPRDPPKCYTTHADRGDGGGPA